MSQRLRYLAD